MGEILGLSNLSGSVVFMQTKDLVPYVLAHKLYTVLIRNLSPYSSQQIIDNFRAQYLIINETLLFVFSTLAENPFLSLDSLNKLKSFSQSITKDLRIEAISKKSCEINYALEDILNSMDPSCRLNTKCALFSLSKPFQSLYSSTSNLIYMNKPWKPEGTVQNSALIKANTQLSTENDLCKLTIALDSQRLQPKPQVHPFAAQFIDSAPKISKPIKKEAVKRIAENSSIESLKINKEEAVEVCKLVIMEKAFVAFQNTKITNLRVVGQIGVEFLGQASGKGVVRIENPYWSDENNIGKRLCTEHITPINEFSYEIDLSSLKTTSPIIDYIVSPNIIEISNIPIYALYNCEKIDKDWIIQLKYQVSSNWKSGLEDISFTLVINSLDAILLEANSRGEMIGNTILWSTSRLVPSQKGILEARLRSSDTKIDHAKIQFKSFNSNLSKTSALLSSTPASQRFLAEIVISST